MVKRILTRTYARDELIRARYVLDSTATTLGYQLTHDPVIQTVLTSVSGLRPVSVGFKYAFNYNGDLGVWGIRNGYGLFGKNGMRVGKYRFDAMYQNGGGGTVFSVNGTVTRFRIELGKHGEEWSRPLWHYHYRFKFNQKTYGNSKPRLFQRIDK